MIELKEVIKRYDEIAEKYDEWLFQRFINEVTWDFLEPYLPKKSAYILDAGGGTGLFAIPLAQKGHDVMVVDVSKAMLNVLRKKLEKLSFEKRIKIVEGDIRDLSFIEREVFDLVLCLNDPLSFCHDSEKAFSELVRVTKKGAVIIVSLKNRVRYLHNFAGGFIQKYVANEDYLAQKDKLVTLDKEGFMIFHEMPSKAFTPQELKELFHKSGVKVLEMASTPCFVSFGYATPNDLEVFFKKKENFKLWLDLEKKYYKRPECLGMGLELLASGIKE